MYKLAIFRKLVLLLFLCSSVIFNSAISQVKTVTEGKYSYQLVENDPTQTRMYKLDNGLTVYLTVYKNAPRIQTYIPVKAGSKMDPKDATGLAHYLEHMLFKGTDKFGTKDYTSEKIYLDEIINLYEKHRNTAGETKRKQIYRQIDSVSALASKYAIANEYDKMMSIIGATGTNAYTSVEQTVYTNDIPSNALEKWLMIEAERFRNPVMRLFHTELETVYEEKNISLDSDNDKVWEKMLLNLFPTHQYGTQSTIGTIEHLKNPSIKKVIEYYNTYYVPNNMAIILSGDFDPAETIELIDKYWGSKPSKEVPEFKPAQEKPITKPIVQEVIGPEAEYLMMAYRFPGANTKENDIVVMIDMILANSAAGLLDINLNQKQKVLSSGSFVNSDKDYSSHILYGNARDGQKLEEVKDLLLEQIEKVKKGDFPDWLPEAIINDFKLSAIKSQESNRSRAGKIVEAFVMDIPWRDEINRIERFSKITKQDIINFASKNYGDNYVIVYKRTGEDKNVQKVEKPQITPVEVNRQDQSNFLKEVAGIQAEDVKPIFLDYSRDLTITSAKNEIPFLYKQNTENDLFSLTIIFEAGSYNIKLLPISVSYFSYLGTSQYTPTQLKEEFYKLGCSYSLSVGEEQTSFSISGLNENFNKALLLAVSVINDLKPEGGVLENLVSDIMKVRADNKLSKEKILWSAMFSYGKYGSKSPFTDILTENELKKIKTEELINIIKELPLFKQKILYYGPENIESVKDKLNNNYITANTGLNTPLEPLKFEEVSTEGNTIYVVNYPDMVQAEIIMLSKKEKYNKELVPYISLYNEYFGGGMSSIVFQELRESKALAYSTFSSYTIPNRIDRSHYNLAYIGTQTDKLPEALNGLTDLLTEMPVSEITFNSAKNNIIQKINTERITKAGILNSYLFAEKMGIYNDIRKDIYEKTKDMTIEDIKTFQQKNIKGSNYTFLVLSDTNKLDKETLGKYGTIKYLTLEEIFGY